MKKNYFLWKDILNNLNQIYLIKSKWVILLKIFFLVFLFLMASQLVIVILQHILWNSISNVFFSYTKGVFWAKKHLEIFIFLIYLFWFLLFDSYLKKYFTKIVYILILVILIIAVLLIYFYDKNSILYILILQGIILSFYVFFLFKFGKVFLSLLRTILSLLILVVFSFLNLSIDPLQIDKYNKLALFFKIDIFFYILIVGLIFYIILFYLEKVFYSYLVSKQKKREKSIIKQVEKTTIIEQVIFKLKQKNKNSISLVNLWWPNIEEDNYTKKYITSYTKQDEFLSYYLNENYFMFEEYLPDILDIIIGNIRKNYSTIEKYYPAIKDILDWRLREEDYKKVVEDWEQIKPLLEEILKNGTIAQKEIVDLIIRDFLKFDTVLEDIMPYVIELYKKTWKDGKKEEAIWKVEEEKQENKIEKIIKKLQENWVEEEKIEKIWKLIK